MTALTAKIAPAKPTILIAEDDPDQSEMLSELLLDEGYAVDTASRGDDALRKLFEHNYDVVILDIRMPGMNGGTVLKAIRTRKTEPHIPIIIVSAFATPSDMQRYSRDGADASLAKPYEIKELLNIIAEVRRRRAKDREIEVKGGVYV